MIPCEVQISSLLFGRLTGPSSTKRGHKERRKASVSKRGNDADGQNKEVDEKLTGLMKLPVTPLPHMHWHIQRNHSTTPHVQKGQPLSTLTSSSEGFDKQKNRTGRKTGGVGYNIEPISV